MVLAVGEDEQTPPALGRVDQVEEGGGVGHKATRRRARESCSGTTCPLSAQAVLSARPSYRERTPCRGRTSTLGSARPTRYVRRPLRRPPLSCPGTCPVRCDHPESFSAPAN